MTLFTFCIAFSSSGFPLNLFKYAGIDAVSIVSKALEIVGKK